LVEFLAAFGLFLALEGAKDSNRTAKYRGANLEVVRSGMAKILEKGRV
jgi:hypothetical protein